MQVKLGAPIMMSEDQHTDAQTRASLLGQEFQTSLPTVAQAGVETETKRQLEATTDPLKVGMQRWALVSVMKDALTDRLALKIRGCFDTPTAAHTHASKLSRLDPHFDIYIVKMYDWLVLPIDDEMAQHIERKYHDPRLQEIMESYRESLLAADKETSEKHATLIIDKDSNTTKDDSRGGCEIGAREPSPTSPCDEGADADADDAHQGDST
jgi:hypothetical protein